MKLALVTGTNSVAAWAYNGWRGILEGAVNDADVIEEALKKRGYSVTKLVDGEVNIGRFKKEVHLLTKKATKGDVVWITFSGHGAQAPGNERDGYDESLCLFNGQIFDNEIHVLLSKFKRYVNVILFIDACHSGTIYRGDGMKIKAAPVWAVKTRPRMNDRPRIVCNLAVLSGAADDKFSYDGAILKIKQPNNTYRVTKNGYFTKALVLSLDDRLFKTINNIKHSMPKFQKPVFTFLAKFLDRIKLKYFTKL